MRVYLMQHGTARSKEEDPDRPLTDAGRGDVRRVGARLVAAGVELRAVLHSGKTRARETAEELAAVLGAATDGPPDVKPGHGLGPTDDTAPWAERLEDGGELDATALVGHLPFMEKLAARLVVGDVEGSVVRFQKGAVLCLVREDGAWAVRWFVTPEVA